MKSKIHKITLVFVGFGFLSSLIGMLVPSAYIGTFIWLVFYMPVLWGLWICCVFTARKDKFFINLIELWVVINISILFFFIMLAKDVPNWANARGIEMVLGTVYFPIIVPTGLLIHFAAPFGETITIGLLVVLVRVAGDVIGNALSVWLLMSGISLVQSFGLMGIALWLLKRKK